MNIPRAEEQPVLRIEEAAAILGVGRSTAFEMAKAGTLPSIRLSARRLVVPTAALRRMLALDEPEPERIGGAGPTTDATTSSGELTSDASATED